jgi:hypothetical protein
MSNEWQAHIGTDYMARGLRIAWSREIPGGVEYTDGTTGWVTRAGDAAEPSITPLTVNDEQGRALLAALLRHYNGADDARMLRKDYDAERARVDRLIGALLPVQP